MNNVQIISTDGKPTHVVWVLPYDDYTKIINRTDSWRLNHTVPNEVVELMVKKECSPIRAWRLYLRITQREMAQRLQITQGGYSAIENAAKNQKPTLQKVANALGISADLLDFDDNNI